MLKASYCKYFLAFNEPATTSRATMRVKETYFVKVWDDGDPSTCGVGECPLFRGLSHDDIPDYELKLADACRYIHLIDPASLPYSSMRFGFESALIDMASSRRHDAPFRPVTINGLIWMGSKDEMLRRVETKLSQGFRCLKLKIGGIDWGSEVDIISGIRERFPADELQLRLDANEAFSVDEALDKLGELSAFAIHSIEQPIKRGQWDDMRRLTKESPIPIALDEELIGITADEQKRRLIKSIKPDYIILKPALCGGLSEASRWIEAAEALGVGWWATSALESNVGLNAIARWVDAFNPSMPQGLGTGQLYRNNVPSPLRLTGERLWYNPDCGWDYSGVVWR